MKQKGHKIKTIQEGSIAGEMDIAPGDVLLCINGNEITDIFDYQYLVQDTYIEVLVEKPSGEQWLLEIDKEPEEDLGVEFENGLMDDYRSCHNKCIFCFIDQMPKGMRDTLYFKDDDSRLSFLQGNYVTLTNMSKEDVERIIRYRLSPINISFHTTNPDLRCQMLNNRFAGEALKKADMFYEAGIVMNGQIVLCKGVNDGVELERSVSDLSKYLPYLESVSVVPVGLSRYREGLYPLEPFETQDAKAVLSLIHKWQDKLYEAYGSHFIHASDEWYILAGEELPKEERYDGYPQLENGVGMLRILEEEFKAALAETVEKKSGPKKKEGAERKTEQAEKPAASLRRVSVATGFLAYPFIESMAKRLMDCFAGLSVIVYPIRNDFFGERITVSGLLTGRDILSQLKGKDLGETLYLPQNVLRSGEAVFLDDMTLADLGNALQVRVNIVKSSGKDFVEKLLEAQNDGMFCEEEK